MTTFNTSLQHYTPAAGKGIPYDHVLDTFNNTLALKQGDKALDFLVGLQVDVTATGTQNDYNPGTGVTVRWNGASQITITGLVAHLNGDLRILRNVTAAQILKLTNEDVGSTAANRITLTSTNALNIGPGGSVGLQYDGTSSRWRVLFVQAYDEGTWTPTILSTGGGTPTYSVQVGKYIKDGKRVFATGKVTLATKGTLAAGSVSIGGLPFASENIASQDAAASFGVYSTTTAIVMLLGVLQNNSSAILLIINTGAATSGTAMQVTDLSATSTFSFSITYVASS